VSASHTLNEKDVKTMRKNAIQRKISERRDSPMIKNKRNALKNIKVLIVYQSKYGSTKQYAEWIHQEIKGDLVNIEQGDKPDLAKYDIMIIGGYMRIPAQAATRFRFIPPPDSD
jgi:spore coat polysaccharide biosynthesis predicted glycosyltransferase SpsG